MKKNIIISILLNLIFWIVIVSPVLFQEGNPIPIVNGIIKLNFNDSRLVKISDNPQRYISKVRDGKYPLIELMENEGWEFNEQIGAGYNFLKDDSELIITSVHYTGRYIIWEFPMKKDQDKDLN